MRNDRVQRQPMRPCNGQLHRTLTRTCDPSMFTVTLVGIGMGRTPTRLCFVVAARASTWALGGWAPAANGFPKVDPANRIAAQ